MADPLGAAASCRAGAKAAPAALAPPLLPSSAGTSPALGALPVAADAGVPPAAPSAQAAPPSSPSPHPGAVAAAVGARLLRARLAGAPPPSSFSAVAPAYRGMCVCGGGGRHT